jgi:pimeloyl-ACP methyl ester carboxylesterase
VITMYRGAFDVLEQTVPNLRQKVLLPGAGHWIQQERPAQVNRLLLEFLASL